MGQQKRPLTARQLAFSRELRRGQTPAEAKLWQHLRDRRFCGLKFRRQQPVGRYILDFYCAERRWAIELDGGQHTEPEALENDEQRSNWLTEQGITVTRFWNHEVLANRDAVFERLSSEAKRLGDEGTLTPALSQGERGSDRSE